MNTNNIGKSGYALYHKRERNEETEEGFPKKRSLVQELNVVSCPSIWETVTTKKLKNHESIALIKNLLNQGANIDERNEEGTTPLIWAASRRLIKICTFLVESKANVNAQDKEGRTALMYAAGCLTRTAVKLLLESRSNCVGTQISRILINNGADVHIQNKSGLTALGILVQATFNNCARWFYRANKKEGKILINASIQLNSEQQKRLHTLRLCLLRTHLLKELRWIIIKEAGTELRKENFLLTSKSLFRVDYYDNRSLPGLEIPPSDLQRRLHNYLLDLVNNQFKRI